MFRREDWSEIVRVHAGVALIPLFKVDVPSSSQRVRFRSEPTGSEADNHVERVEVLGPTSLPSGEQLRGREVL